MENLGKRVMACKHWRWMAGMLTTTGVRVDSVDPDGIPVRIHFNVSYLLVDAFPDFTDPATIGCLVALVRGAWAGHLVWWEPDHRVRPGELFVYDSTGVCVFCLASSPEVEALVAALEAAPEAR